MNEVDTRKFALKIEAIFKRTSALLGIFIEELFRSLGCKLLDTKYKEENKDEIYIKNCQNKFNKKSFEPNNNLNFKNQNNDLVNENKMLKSEVLNLNKKIAELNNNIVQLNNKISSLNNRKVQNEEEIKRLTLENINLSNKIKNIGGDNKFVDIKKGNDKDEEFSLSLMKQIEIKDNEINKFTNEINNFKTVILF